MSATDFFRNISRSVSAPRFNHYRALGASDVDALSCYLWNIALAEALYPPLQILEVSFRNSVHLEVGALTPAPDWLSHHASALKQPEEAAIETARESLRKRSLPETEPYLVSELSFGFWTSLLDARYDKLWHKIIKNVFPFMPRTNRTRAEASARMNKVRGLRNAAMHHHSIYKWVDLNTRHADIHALIAWICPASSRMAHHLDRFPAVYAKGKTGFTADAMIVSA
jgi:hypothetical protein